MSKYILINRLKFIGDSAKVVAVAYVAPLYSLADKKENGAAPKTRLAFVGTGSRGSTTQGKPVVEVYRDRVAMLQIDI